jgi:AbrB family looped-hinge helix DNA binding protein
VRQKVAYGETVGWLAQRILNPARAIEKPRGNFFRPIRALSVLHLIPTVSPWAIFGRRSATLNPPAINKVDNSKYEFIFGSMKIGERGQVTIPKKYRNRFGLSPMTDVEFIEQAGQLVLKKSKKESHPINKYVGVLKARGLRSDDLVEAMRGR